MHEEVMQVRLDEMRGAPVYDGAGDKIGSVQEIFYDLATDRPEWIGVGTGFFGTKRVLVPVEGASVTTDGVMVRYDKDLVRHGPDIDSDTISQETEDELRAYYELGSMPAAGRPAAEGETVTRHEEELQVGKRDVEAGQVRLRKWVDTEPVALQVQLRRETVRVVREPLDGTAGPQPGQIGEETVAVTLHEERPVVAKEVVAKERIGLEKDIEARTETVTDEVRKERIEVEGDLDDRR